MMAKIMQNEKQIMKRGPRRLEYVPQQFRGIPGIESVDTVQQLTKLKKYMEIPEQDRPAYVRIGCSVSHDRGEDGKVIPATSTWAVTVDGKLSIVKKLGDPRSAHKWMSNEGRAWNTYRKFSAETNRITEMQASLNNGKPTDAITGMPTIFSEITNAGRNNYIVMVEGGEASRDTLVDLIKLTGAKPEQVMPEIDGQPLQLLVSGQSGWWLKPELDDLLLSVTETGDLISIKYYGADSKPASFMVPIASWAQVFLSQCGVLDKHPIDAIREELKMRTWNRFAIMHYKLAQDKDIHGRIQGFINEIIDDANLFNIRERDLGCWADQAAAKILSGEFGTEV